ncbi:MAG: SDR family oxidoreductase [Candidatus Marsarchaeota archaeon]|nr:SDR family oxidoreductase [Candidatus Marsarchaeota archaeon]
MVTGGAGYIGSVFVRELLNKGYDVTVLDTLFFGEDSLADIKDRIKLVKKDIRVANKADMEGAYAVVDFAALSNDPSGELDSLLTYDINHMARTNIAKLSKKAGVQKYLAPSSCAIYGNTEELATEVSPVNPLTAYAKANYQWENDILPLADDRFSVTVFRQSTVYGLSHKMRFDLLVNSFTQQAFLNRRIKIKGNGAEFRPFVHVKDDCNAFVSALDADSAQINKQIFNVGSNEQNIKVSDLMNMIPDALHLECEREFGDWVDKRNYRVSFDKIATSLKFKARHSITDGIKEIYEALKSGALDPNDPRFITVGWYKKLISEGALKLLSNS